jgi:predicted phosphodiesterase
MGDLENFAEVEELLSQVSRLDRANIKAKTAVSTAKSAQKLAVDELEAAEKRLKVYEAASTATTPRWLAPKKPKKSEAIAVAMLSDCHFDEVVRSEEVDGVNAYDRRIAEMRLKKFVEKTIEVSRDYVAGVDVKSLVLLFGGDMVSGDIHEELTESNEGTMLETVIHWTGQLESAVVTLADYFGKVHVASVVGNHGRRTRRPRSKKRVVDNFDWLLTHSVAQRLRDDKRITWDVPETADCLIEIYSTRLLLTHGDKVTGGSGIGGIWPPVKRLQARLNKNPATAHDVLVMGHFHQLVLSTTSGICVNGSLKGWDEYAATNAFEWEEPRQAWFLVTPTRGVTIAAPLFVADPVAEGWR